MAMAEGGREMMTGHAPWALGYPIMRQGLGHALGSDTLQNWLSKDAPSSAVTGEGSHFPSVSPFIGQNQPSESPLESHVRSSAQRQDIETAVKALTKNPAKLRDDPKLADKIRGIIARELGDDAGHKFPTVSAVVQALRGKIMDGTI
jgi:hypothetical protein